MFSAAGAFGSSRGTSVLVEKVPGGSRDLLGGSFPQSSPPQIFSQFSLIKNQKGMASEEGRGGTNSGQNRQASPGGRRALARGMEEVEGNGKM